MSKQLSLQGFLSSVTDYKKLVFQVDESTFNKVNQAAKDCEGKSPIKKSDTGKYYLSVSLSRFEKAKIQKYVKMERHNIDFVATINLYDFVDKESTEQIKGWSLILSSIKKITKPLNVSDKVALLEQQISIEQQLADLTN